MIKTKNFFSKTLIITVTLATLLATSAQAATVQASSSNGKDKVTTQSTSKADKQAAAAVDSLISKLPKGDKITLAAETAVNAASTAYNALTDTQKSLVKSTNKTALTAALSKITELKNAQSATAEDLNAASAVNTLIAALPKVDKITLANEAAVSAANTAYNTLTDAQKSLVKSSNVTILTTAVSKIDDLNTAATAAASVDALITALPKADKITASDATAVNEAYAAYTSLTKDQKALLTRSNSGKITSVYNKVKSLIQSITKALSDLNAGKKSFSSFAKAGVNGAIEENKNAYLAAIAEAKKAKGSALTLEEIQAAVDTVNGTASQDENASTALAAINAGTEAFADFATAGVTGAVEANKAAYDTEIATAKTTKGSDLTLTEVQAAIETVNAAVTQSNNAAIALTAINSGTEVFADFATAGATGAVEANKAAYDTEIATAKTTKGSDLTLAEVQTVIDTVNQTVAAPEQTQA